tara:strand:- start:1961 stop:2878 length:918 start_codon:yes stop_codon:yes gene_type:complete
MIIKKNKFKKIREIIFSVRQYITIITLLICIIFFLKNFDFSQSVKILNFSNTFKLFIIFSLFLFFESMLFQKILSPFIKISIYLSYSLTVVSYFLNLILPFSGIGFRYLFLKSNYDFSLKNMFLITSFFYIINFTNLFIILTIIYLFFLENIFLYDYKNLIFYILISLFVLVTSGITISVNKFKILNIFKKYTILNLLFISLLMYSLFAVFIFFVINTIRPEFNNVLISTLITVFVDLALVIQILPFGIGSIELIFYNLLSKINFSQSEILGVISLFRIIIHSLTLILGAILFYKYFKLSLKKFK